MSPQLQSRKCTVPQFERVRGQACEVAVKVLRPDIDDLIKTDIECMYVAARYFAGNPHRRQTPQTC